MEIPDENFALQHDVLTKLFQSKEMCWTHFPALFDVFDRSVSNFKSRVEDMSNKNKKRKLLNDMISVWHDHGMSTANPALYGWLFYVTRMC